MQHLHQPDIVFDRRRVLEPEENRRPSGLLRPPHVVGIPTLENQIGKLFEPSIPAFDIEHRLPKVLMICRS